MESNLTVIVPNYNNAKYIELCIRSIFDQSVKPDFVICVDDCSTDNSKEILTRLKIEFKELMVVFLEENKGVSNARNVGINMCSTKYLTFLDSDDFNVNKDKYKNELEIINSNDNLLVYSEMIRSNNNGDLIKNKPHLHFRNMNGKCTNKLLAQYRFKYGPFDYIVKTDNVRRIGSFSYHKNLYEDLDLLIRLSFICKFKCTNQIGRAYRYTPNGLSKAVSSEHKSAINEIRHSYMPQLSLFNQIIIKYYILANNVIKQIKFIVKKILRRA